jgi:hypothetical protein
MDVALVLDQVEDRAFDASQALAHGEVMLICLLIAHDIINPIVFDD